MAWNMMGGQIDWAAVPIIVELLGVPDVEIFVRELATLRDYQRAREEAERGR